MPGGAAGGSAPDGWAPSVAVDSTEQRCWVSQYEVGPALLLRLHILLPQYCAVLL